MKCKVVSAEKEIKDIKYPCLMISQDGEIVLFTDYRVGVCLFGKGNCLGEYSDSWGMEYFTYDPNLTIELTNKE